jgi:hypothetical protein
MADLLQDRPAARRFGGGMVLSVPLPPGRWCLWLLPAVPSLTDLAPLLGRAQALSAGLAAAGGGRKTAPDAAARLAGLAARLKAPLKRPEPLVQFLGEQLVETGQASGLAVFTLKGAKAGKLWSSDARLRRHADLLRGFLRLAAAHGMPKRIERDPAAAEADPAQLEASLILERLGAASLTLQWPAAPGAYGAILFDAPEPPEGLAADLPALMQLMRPLRQAGEAPVARWWRPAAAVAGLALAVFLLWPVPQRITLSGVAVPAHSVVAALGTDATLEAMLVRVGDQVTEGQPVARFRSQSLSEQLAQEQLTVVVEELNAQAAMAENDYGAVQLHQSRRQIAEARAAELRRRLEKLFLAAPATGRVISAIAQNTIGAGFTAGRDVVTVQTDQDFLMVLTLSRVDARRLVEGAKGEALFRGLTDADYPVEILTPPVLVRDPQSGEERLEATARILDADDRLMAGLTGYARMQGETTPRILGLTHYLIEYARITAWTYLGLRW